MKQMSKDAMEGVMEDWAVTAEDLEVEFGFVPEAEDEIDVAVLECCDEPEVLNAEELRNKLYDCEDEIVHFVERNVSLAQQLKGAHLDNRMLQSRLDEADDVIRILNDAWPTLPAGVEWDTTDHMWYEDEEPKFLIGFADHMELVTQLEAAEEEVELLKRQLAEARDQIILATQPASWRR
jgi:hypothetical protein